MLENNISLWAKVTQVSDVTQGPLVLLVKRQVKLLKTNYLSGKSKQNFEVIH
jgi:hypothetical protein